MAAPEFGYKTSTTPISILPFSSPSHSPTFFPLFSATIVVDLSASLRRCRFGAGQRLPQAYAMGFSVEYSGVVVAQFLHHHAALLLFMIRGLFYGVLRSLGMSDYLLDDELSEFPSSISSSSLSWVSAETIRENLQVVTFASLGDMNGCSEGGAGSSSSGTAPTCAVCLNEFRGKDKVRELRNCCHIFHKKCLDRWLDLDQKTCPLCRTPFLLPASSSSGDYDKSETSWCVEHLLYLFGDDLLFPYSS